ncbi:hypothetical protein ALC53_01716 [Atta colombica]|uniref:Uncharacterized protein n=1 Tax=Atta colombica TaxID=520822 RepID=A0A195BU03_9HYME|nr:hypothetical protein ALC53_01716 [Atta colombica]
MNILSWLQSQALALTHKASPPSRPSSVSSLPRSPQSHQSQQSQPQNAPQHPSVHPLQSQTPLGTPQTPFSAHNQHPKQEINASPKQEGFDLSKSASSTGTVGRTATRCSQRGGYCDPYELIRIKFKSLAMRLGDLRTFTMASCAIRSGSLRHLTLRDTPSQEMKHLLWRVAFEFSLFTFSSVDRTM